MRIFGLPEQLHTASAMVTTYNHEINNPLSVAIEQPQSNEEKIILKTLTKQWLP